MKFQYIGDGKSPPRNIVFMGRIPFELDGMPVDIVDPDIIAKLLGNKCFISEQAAADPEGDYAAQIDDDMPETDTIVDLPVAALSTPKKRGRPPLVKRDAE